MAARAREGGRNIGLLSEGGVREGCGEKEEEDGFSLSRAEESISTWTREFAMKYIVAEEGEKPLAPSSMVGAAMCERRRDEYEKSDD
jgi:hypothetical protein